MPLSLFPIFFLLYFSCLSISATAESFTSFTTSNSSWQPSQNKTLMSPNSIFAAGFHSSPNSPSLFIFSIWYHNLLDNQAIIWSANLDSPVQSSASLSITSNGDLQLTNRSSSRNLWSPPVPRNSSSALVLGDDGNLRFGTWESFRHPTDTIVPNQEITDNTVLKSRNGKYEFSGTTNLVFNGSDIYWAAPSGLVSLDEDGVLAQENGQYLSSDFNQNRTRRLVLGDDGNLRIWSFDPDKRTWIMVWDAIQEICIVHGLCGPGSICYSDGSTESDYECVCPPGFKWASGPNTCERKNTIIDLEKTKFLRLDYVNYSSSQPDLKLPNFNKCESKCLSNPRCLGFGFKYDGSGYCVLQLDNLLNGYWSPATQIAFYLRVDESESDPTNFTGMSELLNTSCPIQVSLPDPPKESHETTRNIIIISALFTIEIATGVLLFWAFLKRYVKYRDMARTLGLGLLPTAGPRRFTYAEIKTATKDFSNDNVIGKGGFSDVYIGKLQDGRPVAVKCLKDVNGGDADFWAEVTIIARMHHLNLVRLWGFCSEKGQRILVYEHVPNGSLDNYLFRPNNIGHEDPNNVNEIDSTTSLERKPILDWNVRYRIALGVARAIAYLHEECLEWVLHCDIKPENILLGDDFCPKVADFGLSKLKKKEQLVTMSRIRGTRGYLAPEWTKNDSITSKVDVYSFGMVLLEIVSGVRNTMPAGQVSMASEDWYFPTWVFETAIQERRLDEILDKHIKHSYDSRVHFRMVDRMVKTAMWCVQERPEMRPSMGKVAKMLDGTVEIMEPPKPTIFYIREEEQEREFAAFSS